MPKTAAAMPRFTPAPAALTRQFEAMLSNIPDAEPRKMFGYLAGFIGGNLFAGIFRDSIVVRLPEADRAELLGMRGARPFEPMPGRVMREYVILPKPFLADGGKLESWLMRARDYTAQLPAKAKKPKSAAGAKKAPRRK